MADISNWRNDTVLYEYHVEKEWSPRRIADEAEVPVALVTDYLENRDMLNSESRQGTSLDSSPGAKQESEPEEHVCPDCGEEFESVDEWADHHQSEHYTWEVHRKDRL